MLTDKQQSKLKKIFEELDALNSQLSEENYEHYLEAYDDDSETILRGNAEGLVYLSKLLLQLAHKRVENSHFHVEDSIMDHSEKYLTEIFKTAD